jgi:protein involved in polysaccharide export with SLBB domain
MPLGPNFFDARFLVCLFFVLPFFSACQTRESSMPRGHSQTFTKAGEYRVGDGDILEIQSNFSKEPSLVVTVGVDGTIVLPLAGALLVRGSTLAEISKTVSRRQDPFIKNANFTAALREMRSFKVAVFGEVKTNGEYGMFTRSTVLEVLARAGGLTDFASERFTLLRKGLEGASRFDFSLEELVRAEASGEAVYVERADILLVH